MTGLSREAQRLAALAFLREKFFSGLSTRTRDMRAAIDALAVSGSGEAEERIARMFHSLAGIGGTYGFHEITFLAKAGEAASMLGERRGAAARIALLRTIVGAIETAGGCANRAGDSIAA